MIATDMKHKEVAYDVISKVYIYQKYQPTILMED
jgi:hypothetical protein